MRSYGLVALLAGSAIANPVPQGIDWDAVEALEELPTPSIPVVNAEAAQTTVSFEPTAAAAAVEAAVLANPNDKTLERRSSCSGPDAVTPEQWKADIDTSNAATPAGYSRVYANKQASSQGVFGYMGYAVLPAGADGTPNYDTQECAKKCDEVKGCTSFNLYYERAPSVNPTETCKNPKSETVLKCVYYGGPVSEASATNDGQWRLDFHVVIAGSNGYTSNAIATPAGYQAAVPLGKKTINAPGKDCEGNPTYMGVKTFQDGPFSVEKCAAACSATSEWNRAHPHVWSKVTGRPRVCQMFNTYILYNGTTATGQFCAMYDQTWSTAFATNEGQWRGPNRFSPDYSFMFSNTTGAADQPESCDNPARPGAAAVQKCDLESQYWDRTSKACASFPVCDADTHWLNKTTRACVAYPLCDADTHYLNKETKACVSYPVCDADTHWLNKSTRSCDAYPLCTSSQWLNKESKTCVDYPVCDPDTQWLDTETKACVAYPRCNQPQWLNKETKTCIPYPRCTSSQWLDREAKLCKPLPVCNSVTQWVDTTVGACIDYPICDSTQWLDKVNKVCKIPAPNSCQALLVQSGNTYRARNGRNFDLMNCEMYAGGQTHNMAKARTHTPSYAGCLEECANLSTCKYATWTNEEHWSADYKFECLTWLDRTGVSVARNRGSPYYGAKLL